MVYVMSGRFEVRLNDEYLRKLREIAEEYQTTPSEAVRRAIDEAHEEALVRRRREALERIFAMESFDDVPDIETIRRQSGRSNDPDLFDPY